MYKLQQAAQQLQQLGWQEWQAVLAVNLCGAVLPAAAWLLDDAGGGRASCLADAQKLLSDAGVRIEHAGITLAGRSTSVICWAALYKGSIVTPGW